MCRISTRLEGIFTSAGLRPATQKYEYKAAGKTFGGENVYAVLHAPRGDATEAVVLVAAWINMDGQFNFNGVSLVLTLARYFTRMPFVFIYQTFFLINSRMVSLVERYYNLGHVRQQGRTSSLGRCVP